MANVINATSTGNGGLVSTGDDSGILNIQTNETTAITVDTSQNVGIGNTAPSAKMDVSGSAYVRGDSSNATFTSAGQLAIKRSTGDPYMSFHGNTGSRIGYLQMQDAGLCTLSVEVNQALSFQTNSAERMRIDSSGNLLVGQATGTQGRIIGNQTASGTNVGYFVNSNATTAYGVQVYYSGKAPNNGGEEFLYCGDSTLRFKVASNGGVYNYSGNNSNLSDQREKKDIALAPNYLDKICQIPVKTFLFNEQTDTELNLGAIAQDVQAVCPELVHETDWGTKEEPKMRLSIYQTDLQYALMKSIQELKAINDTQAETINAQSAALAALTARIVALENRA